MPYQIKRIACGYYCYRRLNLYTGELAEFNIYAGSEDKFIAMLNDYNGVQIRYETNVLIWPIYEKNR